MSEERKVEEERKAERVPTERVVFALVPAMLEIPADATVEQVDAACAALATKKVRKPKGAPAWREVARVTGPTKLAAIEAHAGKAGTPDALVGTFRAPTVAAWKDAEVYTAPPAPLVERTTVD